MKRILLQAVLLLLLQNSYAQSCGTIVSSSAIPANPTNADSNWINIQMYCNVGYNIMTYTVTPTGNSFYIDAYYCAGLTQAITYTNDSIPLGILPAGYYTYQVVIHTAENATGCSAFTITDQDAGNWTVVDSTASFSSLPEMEAPLIAPNPATDEFEIQIDSGEQWQVSITDLKGVPVFTEILSGNSVISTAGWNSGIFIVTMSKGNKQTHRRIQKM